MLFFTNKGRVYRAKAYELPEASRVAKGQHVANLLAFQPDEHIAQVIEIPNYQVSPYLVLATGRELALGVSVHVRGPVTSAEGDERGEGRRQPTVLTQQRSSRISDQRLRPNHGPLPIHRRQLHHPDRSPPAPGPSRECSASASVGPPRQ